MRTRNKAQGSSAIIFTEPGLTFWGPQKL